MNDYEAQMQQAMQQSHESMLRWRGAQSLTGDERARAMYRTPGLIVDVSRLALDPVQIRAIPGEILPSREPIYWLYPPDLPPREKPKPRPKLTIASIRTMGIGDIRSGI